MKKGEEIEREENMHMFGEREHIERANIHSQREKENARTRAHTQR